MYSPPKPYTTAAPRSTLGANSKIKHVEAGLVNRNIAR